MSFELDDDEDLHDLARTMTDHDSGRRNEL